MTEKKVCKEFRPDHNGECLNCDEPFDAHDHDTVRLARHDTLLQLWRGLEAGELLTDLNVLVQLIAFRVQQQRQALEGGVVELITHFKNLPEGEREDFIAATKTAARAAKLAKKH